MDISNSKMKFQQQETHHSYWIFTQYHKTTEHRVIIAFFSLNLHGTQVEYTYFLVQWLWYCWFSVGRETNRVPWELLYVKHKFYKFDNPQYTNPWCRMQEYPEKTTDTYASYDTVQSKCFEKSHGTQLHCLSCNRRHYSIYKFHKSTFEVCKIMWHPIIGFFR